MYIHIYICEGSISLFIEVQWLLVACISELPYCCSEKHYSCFCGETMSEEIASQLYNKPEHRHTLVGNWQEEQKLLETTGTHRYKVLGESAPTQKCLLHALLSLH